MKKFLGLFLFVVCSLIFLSLSGDEEKKPSFVGVDKCKICHKAENKGNQYGKWKESKHSQAYQTVGSDDENCLKCHSPYAAANAELKEDGVGCEACHGAGSEYKSMTVMKDRDAAVEKGLVILDTDEQKEAFCIKCHKADNSYHEVKKFNLKEFWTKIKHPRPEE